MPIVFDSRCETYKSPFGAVTAGTNVNLSLRLPRSLAVSETVLCVCFEFDHETVEYPMGWVGLEEDCDVYTAVLPTAGRLGPLWYSFAVRRFDRPSLYVGRAENSTDSLGVLSETVPRAFQQTVYDSCYDVPDWYGRGVTYHIFPDRFARTSVPNPSGLVGDRTVHSDWSDTPVYLPNAEGEIRNNDFFGGSLAGVMQKLPYLQSLGVTTIYFSPIFEAASNHRYDTSDYLNIDPMFGTTEEFSSLCRQAKTMGIRVILDGVFNHTGYDSRYFNGRGTYDTLGAYQSQASPYYGWYDFQEWPSRYSSWWGVYTLPQVNECNEDYVRFMTDGSDSVIRYWLRAGASGWRLDVADELPDEFIARLRAAARAEVPDAVIIGEVWEDASNKISYEVRRRYLLGRELDGVMNYPLRNALLDFLLGHDAVHFKNDMETLRENYPKPAFYSLMNIIGTHDTPRVLTILGAEGHEYQWPVAQRAVFRLPAKARTLAVRRLKMCSLIQFTFPGSPCVYYGDEAGLEGFGDPLNRCGYPWGQADQGLVDWYTALGRLRQRYQSLQTGDIRYLHAAGTLLAFARTHATERTVTVVNVGSQEVTLRIPWTDEVACDALSDSCFPSHMGMLALTVPPMTGMLLV